jgi:hypothetical protein
MAKTYDSTTPSYTAAPLPDYFRHTCGNVDIVIRNAGSYTIKKGEKAGQIAQSARQISLCGVGQDRPTVITPAGLLELYLLLRDNASVKAEIEKRIAEDTPAIRTF